MSANDKCPKWSERAKMSVPDLLELHEEESEEMKQSQMRRFRILMDEETEADAFHFFNYNVDGLLLDAKCLQHKTKSRAVQEFAKGVEHLMLAVKAMSAQLHNREARQ